MDLERVLQWYILCRADVSNPELIIQNGLKVAMQPFEQQFVDDVDPPLAFLRFRQEFPIGRAELSRFADGLKYRFENLVFSRFHCIDEQSRDKKIPFLAHGGDISCLDQFHPLVEPLPF